MIGLFDSGSGGLTVLSAIRKRAPSADIAYFGDIANAPYGEKSPAELANLTEEGLKKLKEMGATQIVSACNSVSLSVLVGSAGQAEVIEMTRPTARALHARAGDRMLLIATPATISSRIYPSAIGVTVHLEELAIPNLAGLIEFGTSEEEVRSSLRNALGEKKGKTYDAILLGCTHYPLVSTLIQEEASKVFGAVDIVDPAEAVAEEVMQRFNLEGSGTTQFLISKNSETFRKRVDELFSGSSYTIDVV